MQSICSLKFNPLINFLVQILKIFKIKCNYIFISLAELKRRTTVEELCNELPEQLNNYLSYVKELDFFETPDYNHLRSLFVDLLHSLSCSEFDTDFEWNPILEETYKSKEIDEPKDEKVGSKPPEELDQVESDRISSRDVVRLGQNRENKVTRTVSTTR